MRIFKWLWAKLRRRKAHIGFHEVKLPDNSGGRDDMRRVIEQFEKSGAMPLAPTAGATTRYMEQRDKPNPVQKILDSWDDIDNGPRKKEKPNG